MCIFTAAMFGGAAIAGASSAAVAANVGLAISAASAAASMVQQQQSASAMARYQEQMARRQVADTQARYAAESEYQQRMSGYQQEQYEGELGYRQDLIDHQETLHKKNIARTNDAVRRNYSEISSLLGQDRVVAGQEIEAIKSDSREVQAQAGADFAERGVSGLSSEYLIEAFKFNELQNMDAVNQEMEWRMRAYDAQYEEVEAQGLGRMESTTPQPIAMPALPAPMAPIAAGQPYQGQLVNQPNYLAGGLNVLGDGMSLYSQFYRPQNFAPKTAATSNYLTPRGQQMMGYGPKGYRNQSYRPY